MTLKERLKEIDMPKPVCVAGSVVVPPLGIAILVGAVMVLTWILPSSTMAPVSPEVHGFIRRWFPAFLLGLFIATGWVAMGLLAYIHCREFWHDEKPQWAKSDFDREMDFEENFHDCPYCDELDPDEWHEIDECVHQGGTTP